MQTALEQNSFFILGATTRDNRHKIVELAEDRSISDDPDLCAKARSELTSPRNRLTAEVAWLPGVSPKRVLELIEGLKKNPKGTREIADKASNLAKANLLSAAIELLDDTLNDEEWVAFILALANAAEQIDEAEVLRDINEDRAVSGFTPVKGVEAIEEELTDRRRHFKDSINKTLDRLPSLKLLSIITQAVDEATYKGQKQAPGVIDDVVDNFALAIHAFLQQGATNIYDLIKHILTLAPKGEEVIIKELDQLDVLIKKWDRYAQPIQVGMGSRGMEHDISREVAYAIRSLGIDLANNHNMLKAAAKTTQILKDSFSELTELAGRVQEDSQTLDEMLEARGKAQSEDEEWAAAITYEVKIGMFGSDVFSINPERISYRGDSYPLDSITQTRWGAIRHSVNGIPTGTSHTIGFGSNTKTSVIETRNSEIYSAIIDRMWRAVGVRMMIDLLNGLKAGKKFNFADAVVDDEGVEVTLHKFLKNERQYLKWEKVRVWSQSGSFFIGSADDKKVYASMSYIDTPNAHVLESTIRAAFKRGFGAKISGMLK